VTEGGWVFARTSLMGGLAQSICVLRDWFVVVAYILYHSLRCVVFLAKDLVKATAFVPMVRRSAGYLVEGKYHDLVLSGS
jgi:hypothetical protein